MPTPPELVAERIAAVQAEIPASTTLIAVTKQVSVDLMAVAYRMGIRDFGESRVQEAEQKQAQLNLPGITWHLIGHLQRNKAGKALEHFQWIHSLDSLRLAERLDQLAAKAQVMPRLCLQVKLRPDPNKYGWPVDELWQDLPQLDTYKHLRIHGLMAIPPYGLGEDETQAIFEEAHQLSDKIRQQPWSRIEMNQLSMGMSNDYSLAIASGATMVRLGRTLFGSRPT